MTSTATAQPTRTTSTALPSYPSLALLILRLALGAILIAHGAQKVFFYGFAGTGASFAQMGVPMAEIAGPLVGIVELVGGLAIAAGIGTRIASVLVAIDMIVAAVLVHLPNGIFIADGGFELTLILAAAAIALALAGAGRFSLDSVISSRR
ncbi:DoxX family protein [Planctomonas deserti]|uniref:DoxX family protein n=1 Tax=Planctomonas deserti TaxID=2144185 RepID=UPI000D34B923|nr:DoxX family protein [Planctomonas deserti]